MGQLLRRRLRGFFTDQRQVDPPFDIRPQNAHALQVLRVSIFQ